MGVGGRGGWTEGTHSKHDTKVIAGAATGRRFQTRGAEQWERRVWGEDTGQQGRELQVFALSRTPHVPAATPPFLPQAPRITMKGPWQRRRTRVMTRPRGMRRGHVGAAGGGGDSAEAGPLGPSGPRAQTKRPARLRTHGTTLEDASYCLATLASRSDRLARGNPACSVWSKKQSGVGLSLCFRRTDGHGHGQVET